MKFLAIPTGNALHLVRPQAGIRLVRLAENDVGAIGKAVQRLGVRHGVGNVVKIIGNIVSRTVVLVVTATTSLHRILLLGRLLRRAGAISRRIAALAGRLAGTPGKQYQRQYRRRNTAFALHG